MTTPDYLRSQPVIPMAWSIVTSGPYMEMLSEFLAPQLDSKGTYVFTAPLGKSGHIPLICLEDIGNYVLWAFDHPALSTGLELEVATEHVSWEYLAKTFTEFTGRPALFNDVSLEEFADLAWKWQPGGKDAKIGRQTAADDDTLMSSGENFTAWFEAFRATGSNVGLLTRNYELLNGILPSRVKSVKEVRTFHLFQCCVFAIFVQTSRSAQRHVPTE